MSFKKLREDIGEWGAIIRTESVYNKIADCEERVMKAINKQRAPDGVSFSAPMAYVVDDVLNDLLKELGL